MSFIRDGENTQCWSMGDGIAGGLLRKNVIYRASDVFDILDGIPYNMQPWAREMLAKQPELLQGYDERLYPPPVPDRWR